jgi:protoporphyrinogen oxidase
VLVSGIETENGKVTGVRYRGVPPTDRGGQLCMLASGTEGTVDPFGGDRGPEQRVACDRVVNTAPLPALIELLGDAVSPEAHDAARYLRFRALTIVGLRVRRPKALPAQSIYFQDKTFNRLSETRNYGGTEICAPDETILLCDITCDVNDAIWNADPDELGQTCARELEQEGFITAGELLESVVLRSTFGYPVYMVGYEKAIDRLMTELMKFDGLVTGGRQGLYKYVDMDIASEMGLAMADFLASGKTKREAIGNVGYEDRVFA